MRKSASDRISRIAHFFTCTALVFTSVAACAQSNEEISPIIELHFAKLVVDPTPYLDKRIAVVGYAGLGFNLVLFQLKAHSDFGDLSSAVLLQGVSKKARSCSGQFFRAVGTLSADSGGMLQLNVQAIYSYDEAKSVTELCWSSGG